MITATNNPYPEEPDASPTKLDRGGYEGNAETLDEKITANLAEVKALIETYKGSKDLGSITPTSVPSTAPGDQGPAFWRATQNGTYTNFGGFVVPANNFAIFSRDANGVFSVSMTALDITSKVNVSDVVNNLTSSDTNKPVSALQANLLNKNKANLVVQKNRFNKADINIVTDKYIYTSGALFANTGKFVSHYIPIKAGETLGGSGVWKSAGVGQALYDLNKNLLTVSENVSHITASQDGFARFSLTNIADAQIELGTVATTYEDYTLKVSPTEIPDLPAYAKIAVTDDILLNKERSIQFATGVNLFTINGFVHSSTGILDTFGSSYKCTDYIEINSSQKIQITNLSKGGSFRQASFFSAKTPASIISSYTVNDNTTIVLDSSNIPTSARYVRLNTTTASVPTVTFQANIDKVNKYKKRTPVNQFGGKLFYTTGVFVSNQSYFVEVFPVTVGEKINVRGYSQGANNALVVYFTNNDCTGFVSNGLIGTSNTSYYIDTVLTVPATVNFAAIVTNYGGNTDYPKLSIVDLNNEIILGYTPINNKKLIVGFGDSLTMLMGYADKMMALFRTKNADFHFMNCGIGGETTYDIGARQGGIPMMTKNQITIPATTTEIQIGTFANSGLISSWDGVSNVNLIKQNPLSLSESSINPIIIDGIKGNLTWTNWESNVNNGVYKFTRLTAGTARTIPAKTQVITRLPSVTINPEIAIIWIGTNGSFTDNDDLIAQQEAMIRFGGYTKFLVIGLHYVDGTGIKTIANRQDLQAKMLKKWGSKFINWREYALSNAISDGVAKGIIPSDRPSAQDLTDISLGKFPESLRPTFAEVGFVDLIHLNAAANELLFELIYNRCVDLGYLN